MEQIGTAAGKVWNFLKANGPASAAKIQKGIAGDAATTNQAIGWLAREGKVRADRDKKGITYSLTE